MKAHVWLRSALVVTALFASACGGPEIEAVKPGPAIPGLNLSGKYYCKEFGDMQLVQGAQGVTGSYDDPRGPDHNGTVRGTIQGDLLRLEWIKTGNPLAAIQSIRGRAWLRISPDGKALEGRWGFDDSDENGGVLRLDKSIY